MIEMIDTTFINWIKPYVKQLYGSHINMGLPTFSIKAEHHRRKIDYIFKTFSGKWGCIEFEHGDKYGDITSGAIQLDDFYRLQNNGNKVIVDNECINIDFFLLATKYSKEGYLYKNDKRIIQTSGYSETEELEEQNNTIFHTTRWMWRFCGRNIEIFETTNPIGVSRFSVIFANKWNGNPTIELNGKYKIELSKL